MKACRITHQYILRAVDSDLPLAEVLRMDAHLVECASCRAYRDEQWTLNEWAGSLPQPSVESLDLKAALRRIEGQLDQEEAMDTKRGALDPVGPLAGTGVRSLPRLAWVLGAALLAAGVLFVLWVPLTPAPEAQAPLADAAGQERELQPAQSIAPTEPRVVPESSAFSVAKSGAPSETPPKPLDRTAVESQLRLALQAAFRNPGALLLPQDALEAFDQSMGSSYARWPLAAMAERLLAGEDAQLAAAAARYLGLRGGRMFVPSLRARLGDAQLGPACVLALGDLGEAGVESLGLALEMEHAGALALDQLARSSSPAAAQAIERVLLRAPLGAVPNADHLAALGRIGAPAMPALLRLAAERDSLREPALDAMLLVDGAGAELARLAERTRGGEQDELFFAALDRIQALEMLPWIEARTGDFNRRGRALQSLAKLPGPAPLGSLLELAQRGALEDEEWTQALCTLASRDAGRFQQHAEALLEGGDTVRASQFLNYLITSAASGGAGALAVLAMGDGLTEDERQWAALAVGELGGAAEAELLRDALAAGELRERRLMAACLITVFRCLGEEGVYAALGSYPLGAVNEVFEALVEASTDPKQPQAAVQLFRIARVLNMALPSRNPRIGQSSI